MVWPCENGSGCETCGVVWISTVSLPCMIATGDTRTSLPMTMVPVRSLITTRAGRSASTSNASIPAMNSTTRDVYSGGIVDCDRAEFSGSASGFVASGNLR